MWRLCGGSATTERPSIEMSPPVGVSNPAIIIKVVVFPDPLGPSRVRNSPAPTVSETPRTALTRSNRFPTLLKATVAPRDTIVRVTDGLTTASIRSGQDPMVPAPDHGVPI